MIVRELEVCPSDVSAYVLSAWRDGESSPAEAQRIADHLPHLPGSARTTRAV